MNKFATEVLYISKPARKLQLQYSQTVEIEDYDEQSVDSQSQNIVKQLTYSQKLIKEALDKNQDKPVNFDKFLIPVETSVASLINECRTHFQKLFFLRDNKFKLQLELGLKLMWIKRYCKKNKTNFLQFCNNHFVPQSLSQLNKYIEFHEFVKTYLKLMSSSLSMRMILSNKTYIKKN